MKELDSLGATLDKLYYRNLENTPEFKLHRATYNRMYDIWLSEG